MPDDNGWIEYKKEVLYRLELQHEHAKELSGKVDRLTVAVAQLKVKAGLWGAAAGAIPAAIYLLLQFIR